MRKRMFLMAPFAIVGIAVFAAIGGEIVKLLWNWLTPALFGWRPISFWQAVGLLALCRILFGRSGLGRGFRRPGSWRRTPGGWKRMSPEEREKFREGIRAHWGCAPRPADPNPSA